jgi:hypothetical protein
MGPSFDGGFQAGPSMPHHSVRKYRLICVKVTRQAAQNPRNRLRSAAQPAALNERRPLKTGNIVRTRVNALMALDPTYALTYDRPNPIGKHSP